MKTQFDVGQRVSFIIEPKGFDIVALKKINIQEGEIFRITAQKDVGIVYYFGGEQTAKEVNVDTDKTALFRKFYKRMIKIKEKEILEIQKDLLKEVVS